MTGNSQNSGSRSIVVQIVLATLVIGIAIAVVSFFPVRHTESPPFATPAFQRAWSPEAAAAIRVLDLWGSEPLSWRVEPYAGAPNDRRVVQYFERGRMETEAGSSTVTLGYLARELTTGEIDLGDEVVEDRQPPEIPIDSGELDDRIPTYLTLSRVVYQAAPDRSRAGERITDWIDRTGPIERPSTPEVRRYEEHIEETGFSLPDVTSELFERPEFQGGAWVESFGYPISEPYWTEYRRKEGMLPSLVQVFERRILVYTPGLEDARSFTIASSGRHYSLWRYGSEPDPSQVEPPEDALDPELTLGDDLEAWVYADGVGTPIDLALSATGHLMILTSEGQILKTDSLDPDGNPTEVSVWASGIENPQGMVTRGESALVTESDRTWWYHDQDGQGVRSDVEVLLADDTNSPSGSAVQGKPVTNSAGDIFTRSEQNDSDEVLTAIASDQPLLRLNELVQEPGPAEFSGGDLLLAGRDEDERTSVVLVPSLSSSEPLEDPVSIASFPRDSIIWSLAVADESIWDVNALGEVLIGVQDGEDARLFALSRPQTAGEMEVVELARGMSLPTAMQVGLDGSIYVADAENGRVIRIRYSG